MEHLHAVLTVEAEMHAHACALMGVRPHTQTRAEALSTEFLCSQPVDRDPVVCHPDLEDLLQPWPAEVPDEFFEVTVDDVRRRLAQLKSERWVPLAL